TGSRAGRAGRRRFGSLRRDRAGQHQRQQGGKQARGTTAQRPAARCACRAARRSVALGHGRSPWSVAGRGRSPANGRRRAETTPALRGGGRPSVGGGRTGTHSMWGSSNRYSCIGSLRDQPPGSPRSAPTTRAAFTPFSPLRSINPAPTRQSGIRLRSLTKVAGGTTNRGLSGRVHTRNACMALDPRTLQLIESRQSAILEAWIASIGHARHDGGLSQRELESQAREFWQLFVAALESGAGTDSDSNTWQEVRHFLEDLSRERVLKGFSSSETATFIFALKRPLFGLVQEAAAGSQQQLGNELWEVSELLDGLGLHTV